jgi:hypothetical protein
MKKLDACYTCPRADGGTCGNDMPVRICIVKDGKVSRLCQIAAESGDFQSPTNFTYLSFGLFILIWYDRFAQSFLCALNSGLLGWLWSIISP